MKRSPSPEIVDVTEIATRLRVAVSTVHKWRQRDLDFPDPLANLAIGPVWAWPDVREWAKKSSRLYR